MCIGRYIICALVAAYALLTASSSALLAAPPAVASAAASSQPSAAIIVKYMPDAAYETERALPDKSIVRYITKQQPRRSPAVLPPSDAHLVWRSPSGVRISYLVDEQGQLYDEARKELLELPAPLRQRLSVAVRDARTLHYGRLVSWDKARKLIPKRASFTITELESGLTFHAQNRAGARHVDAQPLTAADTAIMKQIYGGAWSWRRKAIIVRFGRHTLAASMHGMPHGGDGIPGNRFAGHFCIHFLGSRTHGSGRIDPEHHLMVHKAAGQLPKLFDHADPEDVVRTFITALNMGERRIAAMTFADAEHRQLAFFNRLRQLDIPESGRPPGLERTPDPFAVEVPLEIRMQRSDGHTSKLVCTFHLKRNAIYGPWKIDFVTMVGREPFR